jgi:hypothetical protein
VTEAELLASVLQLCDWLGLLAYHTHDSRRSQPGFPDLVIAGVSGVLFRELKSVHGVVSGGQRRWLRRLAQGGADSGVWRPLDWPDRIRAELEAIAARPAAR